MAQYQHRRFFRSASKELLARYFQDRHQVLLDFAFAALKPSDVEPLFIAFTQLPFDTQTRLEAELQQLDRMACAAGIDGLVQEALCQEDTAFVEKLAAIAGFHDKVLWAFLEFPQYWNRGNLFRHVDGIAESYWKKRKDLPQGEPKVDQETIQGFAAAISHYFHTQEGRGRHCQIDVLRRDAKDYFFAYPEDYAQNALEWVRQQLGTRARHPTFEIIFVYSQTEGALDLYAPGNTQSVPQLQQLFASHLLGLESLDPDASDARVFRLEGLARREFVFVYPPSCGIDEVVIRKLRLSLVAQQRGNQRRVTLEVTPSGDLDAIYDLMAALRLPRFVVTQAEIKVTFRPGLVPGTPTRTFRISYPNWCSLRHDGRDSLIRQMLRDSGIDPAG